MAAASMLTTLATGVSVGTDMQRSHRTLRISLIVEGHDSLQFAFLRPDSRVEDLFLKVQDRLDDRITGQQIVALDARLLSQGEGSNSYYLKRNDPDTWEVFIERTENVEGDKANVNATVKLRIVPVYSATGD